MRRWLLAAFVPLMACGSAALAQDLDRFTCLEPAQRAPTSRIVGGQQASDGEYPWQVSLHYLYQGSWIHWCGGAVINDLWILTAAHCVFDEASRQVLSPADYQVRTGTVMRETAGQLLEVEAVIVHPDYDKHPTVVNDNDIALLKLTASVDGAQAIPMAAPATDRSFVFDGACSVVSGWGALRPGGELPEALNFADLPILSLAECQQAYGADKVSERQICAGYAGGGMDSCLGDSGGPLVVRGLFGTQAILVGVVSWGRGCAGANAPGVYTRVAAYRDWIDRTIEQY